MGGRRALFVAALWGAALAMALAPSAVSAQGMGMGMSEAMGGMANMEADRTGMALPSTPTSRYDAAQEYEAGVAALRDGDYRAAERAFDRVTEAAPGFSEGYFLLGLARVQRDRLSPARRAFEDTLRRDEAHIGARAELAAVLARLGEIEAAQTQLDVLEARAASCAQTCPEAADLAAATAAVEGAIAAAQAAE